MAKKKGHVRLWPLRVWFSWVLLLLLLLLLLYLLFHLLLFQSSNINIDWCPHYSQSHIYYSCLKCAQILLISLTWQRKNIREQQNILIIPFFPCFNPFLFKPFNSKNMNCYVYNTFTTYQTDAPLGPNRNPICHNSLRLKRRLLLQKYFSHWCLWWFPMLYFWLERWWWQLCLPLVAKILTERHTQGSAHAPWGRSAPILLSCARSGSCSWTSRCESIMRGHYLHRHAIVNVGTVHNNNHLMKGLEMATTVRMNQEGWAMMRDFKFFLSLLE